MSKFIINTTDAPEAIGAYSQAVMADNTIYISGQIPLVPSTGEIISEDFSQQAKQVFGNLSAIARAAQTDLDHAVKFTVYLTDLRYFSVVNEVMANFLQEPYPARAAVQVAALPKEAKIQVDAILCVS